MRRIVIVIASICLIASPANAWDPIRDLTGKTLKQHVESAAERTVNSAEKFLHNPIEYLASRPARILSEVCAAPINGYRTFMNGQAQAQWRTLPADFVRAAQPFYSTNLWEVRYTENAATPAGNAMVMGKSIYFPRPVNFNNPSDVHWMLHEIEHVVQFDGAEHGRSGEICNYMMHALGAGLQHDNIAAEQAADRKADYVLANMRRSASFSSHSSNKSEYLPQAQLAANEIVLVNPNPYPVTFWMGTLNFPRGWAVMQPYSSHKFYGHAVDRIFFLEIFTDFPTGQTRRYREASSGMIVYIRPDPFNGALDFWST